MSWSKNCIISEIRRTPEVTANPDANPPKLAEVERLTTTATFQINNAKLYVRLKQRFRGTVSWNKYRFEITKKSKINNLDYIIDPTSRNIKRFFVLSFKNVYDDHARNLLSITCK